MVDVLANNDKLSYYSLHDLYLYYEKFKSQKVFGDFLKLLCDQTHLLTRLEFWYLEIEEDTSELNSHLFDLIKRNPISSLKLCFK